MAMNTTPSLRSRHDAADAGSRTCIKASVYSLTGKKHLYNHQANEDVIFCRENGKIAVYGIADGQSGKKYCAVGAKKSLCVAADYIEEKTVEALMMCRFKDELQYELISAIRRQLLQLAEEKSADISSFSSTILLLAVDTDTGNYVIVHLGDGFVLGVSRENTVSMLSAPDNGFTNRQTWLTTSENAMFHLRIAFGNISAYSSLVLASDGAECLCRGKTIQPHARALLTAARDGDMGKLIKASEPADDVSCIILRTVS